MSNVGMIIEERPANIGNFLVGRLLPFRGKRTVGPFIFIDHMGPEDMGANENLDVGPHPHIGLSTLTYLFEGSIFHRDSLGTKMEITPGAVNWMTAGRGVVHSERTPEQLRGVSKKLHGLQIWVALPKELEDIEPSFHHVEARDIPCWEKEKIQFRLISGEFDGHTSPVPVYSKQFFIEIKNTSTENQVVNIGDALFGEAGLYILDGEVEIESKTHGAKQILVAKESTLCQFSIKPKTTVYIFGGEPFPEERYIYWNFVSSDPKIIEDAKQRWRDQAFDPIPEEVGFVSMPE